jgi:oligopeptide transport system substrate-binding protein
MCLTGCERGPENTDEVVMNQRLRVKVQTLDPANVGDTSSDGVCKDFFECLYQYHYLKRPYELIPHLAADMPEISPDGTTYRIRIRRDVYFHDDPCFPEGKGRLLKAADFVYAWKRIADTKVRSKNWFMFDGKIKGLDAFREYSKTCEKGKVDYDRPVEGLYAEDDFTLVIKLVQPWPQLIYWLAHLPTAPMAREAVEHYGPEDIVKHPVGTGAFILKTWHRGAYIEAVRNPNYYEAYYPSEGMPEDVEEGLLADAGKRLPFIDRIIWRIMEEDQPRWLLLMRGDIDLNSIPKDNFGQAVAFGDLTPELKERGMRLTTVDEPCTFWVGMNMNDPLLGGNKALRYAISHALTGSGILT